MIEKGDYRQVRDVLLASVRAVETEEIPLERSAGRILAGDITAREDVPSFARSPYDGYAFRAADTAGASAEHPVTLQVTDYIPAGEMPHGPVTAGTAAHLMTGAPVPEGADAVLPFEKTLFTEKTVTILGPAAPGSNIILPGEDLQKGSLLSRGGRPIDAGLAGTMAGQGIFHPQVYRVVRVGVISTGTELLEEGDPPSSGKIYNTNRYSLQTACARAGCHSVYLGTARDEKEMIRAMLQEALKTCDAVLLSGGVSVGDYDCTPAAMEEAGVTMLARGAALKPGMAGAYGIFNKYRQEFSAENDPQTICDCIPVFALSGNPAACMTAFYAIALPVLKKRMGLAEVLPAAMQVRLGKDYQRKNQSARLLRGKIDFSAVCQEMTVFEKQGNQMLSSLAGSNAFALIPADACVGAEDSVEAFLLE